MDTTTINRLCLMTALVPGVAEVGKKSAAKNFKLDCYGLLTRIQIERNLLYAGIGLIAGSILIGVKLNAGSIKKKILARSMSGIGVTAGLGISYFFSKKLYESTSFLRQ